MKTHQNVSIATIGGGNWLVSDDQITDVFIPEEFTEEQRMIAQMCRQFIEKEVFPQLRLLDEQRPGKMQSLLASAGELGLLGTAIPEEYGGLEKDFITNTIVSEEMGVANSFSVSYICQVGIGTLPILYFGNDHQKKKYLSKLSSGEWLGSYGLTEPGSGSDALAAKTTATLSEDGKHYILNGQKCWITNGGWAKIFTVFAVTDDGKFTAFLVERDTVGFSVGPEEKKMGIKGSSTVQLFFNDCMIPVDNVLGLVGRGHIIAFNILNIGRYKMAAACIGCCKRIANLSISYSTQRMQFNTALSNFGLIRQKLAGMAVNTWVSESAIYRLGKEMEDKKRDHLLNGCTSGEAELAAAEEFAMECALMKVFCTEVYDTIVDEGVQIHGGNGYSAEYPISYSYVDSRINRIFEGTNEINRLLAINILVKRALNKRIDLFSAIKNVYKELGSNISEVIYTKDPYAQQMACVRNLKRVFLLVAGAAYQNLKDFESEQEIIGNLADIAMHIYAAESAVLRLIKLSTIQKNGGITYQEDIVKVFLYDAADIILKSATDAANSFSRGEENSHLIATIKNLTEKEYLNVKKARRRIADKMVEQGQYCF